jgi:hypothetical protein
MDPYRLFNGLEQDYRPIGRPDEDPRPPLFPSRLRSMIYGFALIADREAQAVAGGGAS